MKIENNNVYYYHNDHLGTPTLMTSSSGTTVWQGEFKPFGESLSVTGSITNNLRFPGQYNDSETGLHQNYFRDYKAEIGRYVEADPLLHRAGLVINKGCSGRSRYTSSIQTLLDPYGYASDNPGRFSDKLGLYSYDGSATYTSGGDGLGGGWMSVTLTSECYKNFRLIGDYLVIFAGGTLGVPVGRSSFTFTMDDNHRAGGPQLERMTGISTILSASGGLGIGGSIGVLFMGDGIADISGWLRGVDLSTDAFIGYSFRTGVRRECRQN